MRSLEQQSYNLTSFDGIRNGYLKFELKKQQNICGEFKSIVTFRNSIF